MFPFHEEHVIDNAKSKYSDFQLNLLTATSHPRGQCLLAVFVPGYGGGTVTDFHRASNTLRLRRILYFIPQQLVNSGFCAARSMNLRFKANKSG